MVLEEVELSSLHWPEELAPGAGRGGASAAAALSITRDGDGVRYRNAVQESRMVTFADWPINGPRTVNHVIILRW